MAAWTPQPLHKDDFTGFVTWEYNRLQLAIFNPNSEFRYRHSRGHGSESGRGCSSLPFAFWVAYGGKRDQDYWRHRVLARDGAQCRTLLRKLSMRYNQAITRFAGVGRLPERWSFNYSDNRFDLVPLIYMTRVIISYHKRALQHHRSKTKRFRTLELMPMRTPTPADLQKIQGKRFPLRHQPSPKESQSFLTLIS